MFTLLRRAGISPELTTYLLEYRALPIDSFTKPVDPGAPKAQLRTYPYSSVPIRINNPLPRGTWQCASPAQSLSEAKATDNQVRIASLADANERSGDTNKNSSKIYFASCFLSVSKQFSRSYGKKNGANYRNRQDGRSPAQSLSGAKATDNQVRIASLADANERSGDTKKQQQNLFCKLFFERIEAILTELWQKKWSQLSESNR